PPPTLPTSLTEQTVSAILRTLRGGPGPAVPSRIGQDDVEIASKRFSER
ncbi:MAG: hypothetical protein INF04_09645, partial [Phenylobacterium sp.]|nr:hypothetical protein [Phenylobacterium sp.]